MKITSRPDIRQFCLDEMRRELMAEERDGVHLSDLLTPRQAYFRRVKPLPPTDSQIMYWLSGRGHETAFLRVAGWEHGEAKQWEGIWYTPDVFHTFPVEIKTRRASPAPEGEEKERYDHYLKQLLGYCAVENKPMGWLFVWCLVNKDGTYGTKPELYTYECEFTETELEDERGRLAESKSLLLGALTLTQTTPMFYHKALPPCPEWMCGKVKKTMTTKPKCLTCNKEFETETGGRKHPESKTGAGHTVQEGIYETEYEKKCGWFDDCQPF